MLYSAGIGDDTFKFDVYYILYWYTELCGFMCRNCDLNETASEEIACY